MKNFENEKVHQLSILKKSLQRQNDQGTQMMEIVNHMMGIENRVENTEVRINERVSGFEETLEEALERISIDYDQQKEIQSIVNSKANELTQRYYRNGMPETVPNKFHDDLFKKKKGRYIRSIYSKLKSNFNVVRYTALRSVDFKNAKDFLMNIKYTHINPKEVEDLKSWNIPGLFPEDNDENK